MLLSDADNLDMLKTLGEQVEYDSETIWGIFDSAYFELGFERPIESREFRLTVRSSDVSGVTHGKEVVRTVDGTKTTYTVENIQPDGEGMTVLVLSE